MSQPFALRPTGLFEGVFGKRAQPSILSPAGRKDETDIEELLAHLCRPAYASNSTVARSVSVERCNEISDILLKKGNKIGNEQLLAWSERPRIYFVLRNIQRLDLLDYFVKAELTDFHIPFNEDTLPAFLQESDLRESFLLFQQYVLSSGAKGLDIHGGPHLSFAGNAQRFFYYKGSLGRGGYGEVDAVTSRLSLRSYARKRVLRGRDITANQLGQLSLIRELSYLKALSHTHLVRYISSYTDEKHIAFLMQPVADYDLEKLLKNLGRAGTGAECLRPYFGCLAGAIQYLHENKIRHRDLKSRNILIKDGRVFVADFGTAYSWKGSKHSITNHRNVPFTAEYIAPEIALHQSRSTASKMWSLGVVFMEMSTVLLGSTIRKLKSRLHAFSFPRGAEPFLWANIPVIDTWIEELTSCAAVRDESAEPLSWVRDLLQERPNKRLRAGDLMRQILESPSFHAFCCVECWPIYEQRSFLYTQRPQDNDTSAPESSADVHAQLSALLDPPVDKARTQEKDQTIESWLGALGDNDLNTTTVSINDTAELSDTEVPIQRVADSSSYYSVESSDEERMVQLDALSITRSFQSLDNTIELDSGQTGGESARTIAPGKEEAETVQDLATQCEAPKHEAEAESSSDSDFKSEYIWSLAGNELNVWADDSQTDRTTRGPEFPANTVSSSRAIWGYIDQSPDHLLRRITPNYQEQELVPKTLNDEVESAAPLLFEHQTTTASSDDKALASKWTEIASIPSSTCTGTQNRSKAASASTSYESEPTVALSNETKLCGLEQACERVNDIPKNAKRQIDGVRFYLSRKSNASLENRQENLSKRAPESELDSLQGPRSEKEGSNKPVNRTLRAKGSPKKANSKAENQLNRKLPVEKKDRSQEQPDHNATGRKLQGETTNPESKPKGTKAASQNPSSQVKKPRTGKDRQVPQTGKPQSDTSQPDSKPKAISPGISGSETQKLQSKQVGKASLVKNLPIGVAQLETQTEAELNSTSSSSVKSGSKESKGQTSSTKKESAKTRSKKGPLSLHKKALLFSAKQRTTKKKPSTSIFSPEVYMNTTWEAASTQDTRIVQINRNKLKWWKWIDRDQHILESLCTEGAVQAVRILLRDGCNPGTESRPRPAPLLQAILGGTYQHYKCVQALMDHGVNVNITERKTGRTALQIAIEQPFFAGHTSIIRDIIHGGADTNKADHTGKRPILSVFDVQKKDALEKHQLDALACLLVGGGGKETDVNVWTPHTRNSPLHLAIRRRSPMAVGLLLFRGAEVNAKNQAGATPLLLAAAQWTGPLAMDQKTILGLLLQNSDINLNESSGVQRRTALHQAVFRASPSAVETLLEKGADILIKDSEGKTARQLASKLDMTKWKDERAKIIRLLDETKA